MKNALQTIAFIRHRLPAIITGLLCLSCSFSFAATLTVTNGNDSGAGSLRQAIQNAVAGDNIIFSGVSTVTLTSDQLVIDKDLTIEGGSGVTVTRSTAGGTLQFRIFNINNNATVFLNSLNITNGNHPSQAGGVQNSATLTMNKCIVTGNTSGQGGGVQNDAAISLINCVLANNTSSFVSYGGANSFLNCTVKDGIYIATGSVTLVNTITPNFIASTVNVGSTHNLIYNYNSSSLTNGTDGNIIQYFNDSDIFLNLNDLDGEDNLFRTADDGLSLSPCSAIINAGTNTNAPATDITGNPRPYNGGITDIGAYEFQGVSQGFTLAIYSFTEPSNCGTTDGSITFSTSLANGNYAFTYNHNGTPTSLTVTVASNAFTLTGLSFGIYYNFTLTHQSCTSTFSSPLALSPDNQPTLTAGAVTNSASCSGPNGSIDFATTHIANGTYQLNYRKNNSNTSAMVTVAGEAFRLTGLSDGTYSNFSLVSPGCQNAVANTSKVVAHTPCRFYVKQEASGANNGTSWADAFTDLQSALNIADNEDQVWVAAATYKPTRLLDAAESTNPRTRTFFMKNAVKLYGGFAGTESMLTERNPSLNLTVLTGDFNGDDVVTGEGSSLTFANNAENAFHVMYVVDPNTEALIDGFTIKGGNANDVFVTHIPRSATGGGIAHVITSNNSPSEPLLVINNVIVMENSATRGGGIYNGAYMKITKSTFQNNYAAYAGGGLATNNRLDLSETAFKGNRSANKGGGLSIDSSVFYALRKVLFLKNHAQRGGGLSTEVAGFAEDSQPSDIAFVNNTAVNGGAAYLLVSDLKFINATFANNTAEHGGAIAISNGGNPTFKNSIFWGNTAGSAPNNVEFVPAASWTQSPHSFTTSYSIVQGSGGSGAGWNTAVYGTDGGNNLDVNPLFKDTNDEDGPDDLLRTGDDGFSLQSCSPALNVGTNSDIESTDIAGNPRPYNAGVTDMGAYELQNTGPALPTGASVSQSVVCSGTAVSLTASCSSGTVTWYNQSEGGTALGTGSPFVVNPDMATTYYASCKESSCESGRVATQQVVIKSAPTSALTASKVDVCPNTEVTLSPNCSDPTASVQWNPGAPTVTPNAPDLAYTYKVTCSFGECAGNESSVEVRTHRLLADLKNVGTGMQPKALAGTVKDNLAPTNTITAPASPRLWTIVATGCSVSESAVFKLMGPVNFNSIDNNPPYAIFANAGSDYFSIDHPNYGNGTSGFPNGTYTLTMELRGADGVGGPFPKNRVATGPLLATRTLQFTVVNPPRVGVDESLAVETTKLKEEAWLSVGQNPVSTEVVVRLSGKVGQQIDLSLTNLQGQTIQQRSVVLSSVQQYEVLNVAQAASGLYILKGMKENLTETVKVIKMP
ncbi:MAG: choice-of-anchor Q domain-containing protein [Spirosomataceae bacterium]